MLAAALEADVRRAAPELARQRADLPRAIADAAIDGSKLQPLLAGAPPEAATAARAAVAAVRPPSGAALSRHCPLTNGAAALLEAAHSAQLRRLLASGIRDGDHRRPSLRAQLRGGGAAACEPACDEVWVSDSEESAAAPGSVAGGAHAGIDADAVATSDTATATAAGDAAAAAEAAAREAKRARLEAARVVRQREAMKAKTVDTIAGNDLTDADIAHAQELMTWVKRSVAPRFPPSQLEQWGLKKFARQIKEVVKRERMQWTRELLSGVVQLSRAWESLTPSELLSKLESIKRGRSNVATGLRGGGLADNRAALVMTEENVTHFTRNPDILVWLHGLEAMIRVMMAR